MLLQGKKRGGGYGLKMAAFEYQSHSCGDACGDADGSTVVCLQTSKQTNEDTMDLLLNCPVCLFSFEGCLLKCMVHLVHFVLLCVRACVCACVRACVCVWVCVCQRKIELTAWGKKVPIPLDGIRTCTYGIRAHSASNYTTRAGTPHVSQNKNFRRSPASSIVCVCVCVCVWKDSYSRRVFFCCFSWNVKPINIRMSWCMWKKDCDFLSVESKL